MDAKGIFRIHYRLASPALAKVTLTIRLEIHTGYVGYKNITITEEELNILVYHGYVINLFVIALNNNSPWGWN